jgi:hypothetical protein
MPAATVQELQTKLNAKDPTLKLTVDGKLGPATKAAMAKHPDVTTDPNAPQNQPAAPAAPAAPAQSPEQLAAAQTANGVDPATGQNVSIQNPDGSTTNPETGKVTPAAAPAAAPAPAPAAPAPAPGMTAQGDDEGNTTITRPDGSTMVVGADGKQIMPGSNPNLPQNKGVLNTVKNAVNGTGDFQKPTGFQPAPAPTAESVGFQNDELNRIISLVHHR